MGNLLHTARMMGWGVGGEGLNNVANNGWNVMKAGGDDGDAEMKVRGVVRET